MKREMEIEEEWRGEEGEIAYRKVKIKNQLWKIISTYIRDEKKRELRENQGDTAGRNSIKSNNTRKFSCKNREQRSMNVEHRRRRTRERQKQENRRRR